ncbi:oleate hydratase [bacterium]|nr:oleate hydratase [bacterium]
MKQLKRRDFLKSTFFGGAGFTVVATVPGCKTIDDTPSVDQSIFDVKSLGPVNPEAPEKLPEGVKRNALIIGGGVAGLSAALELAERGYSVTIREAAPFVGGKLHTRREQLSVGVFNVEHGLHLWYHQYYVFEDILKRIGVWNKNFKAVDSSFYTFKNYESEKFTGGGSYPTNLSQAMESSNNLSGLDSDESYRALPDVVFYNHKTNYQKFDNLLFSDWAASTSVDHKFYDVAMDPLTSLTLNDPGKTSAAEMILNMHAFSVGHPDASKAMVTTTDHGTAVIKPWRDHLEKQGVSVKLDSPVPGLKFRNGKCVGANDYPKNYDYVVLATDVPGTKSILNKSKSTGYKTKSNVKNITKHLNGLKTADPYRVLRVWIDQPIASKLDDYQAIINTPQHKPINKIAIYDMLEEQSREWAEFSGGSILEIHLYNSPELSGLSPNDIWTKQRANINHCFSQTKAHELIKKAKAIEFSMGSFNNFTSYAPGQAAIKPTVDYAIEQGISNLLFAGDWVQFNEFPNALMERSVATGRLAANSILYMDGVRQATLYGASPKGPGVFPRF